MHLDREIKGWGHNLHHTGVPGAPGAAAAVPLDGRRRRGREESALHGQAAPQEAHPGRDLPELVRLAASLPFPHPRKHA